ncbi:MAG: hypothetical protein HZB38_00695 [Planctomycetes bacterium]|nr:hypothetical protein [Planctomycetota bacterium]
MIARIGRDHPLRKLFGGIIEHVFQTELGICNPRVTDYLADLLADFVHVDRIYNLHDVDGTKLCEISESAASTRLGAVVDDARRRQVVNRFIGDFSLFWTGLYPEQLRLRRRGPDRLRE